VTPRSKFSNFASAKVTVWEEVQGTPDPLAVNYNVIERLFCQAEPANRDSAKVEKKAPTEVHIQ
jgi:hypothetical protein